MRELTNIYHRDDIPFNARGFNMNNELLQFLGSIMVPLADATKVSAA
jgi:primary-amine oxidase